MVEWTLKQTLINACQLIDGWHQDGTAWSEWDEQVRQNLSRHLAACQAVAPPRECGMHADMGCLDASCHHFLKYHDPKSEFYIGGDCVNCCFGRVQRESGAAPAVSTPWCPTRQEINEWLWANRFKLSFDTAQYGEQVADLFELFVRQFFQPAPSPPLLNDVLAWLDDALNSLRTRQYDNAGICLKEAIKLCRAAAPSPQGESK